MLNFEGGLRDALPFAREAHTTARALALSLENCCHRPVISMAGVSTVEDALAAAPDRAPHAVVPSIAALAGLAV